MARGAGLPPAPTPTVGTDLGGTFTPGGFVPNKPKTIAPPNQAPYKPGRSPQQEATKALAQSGAVKVVQPKGNDSTKQLQHLLNQHGAHLAEDGVWGPQTESAYQAYMHSAQTHAVAASKIDATQNPVSAPLTKPITPQSTDKLVAQERAAQRNELPGKRLGAVFSGLPRDYGQGIPAGAHKNAAGVYVDEFGKPLAHQPAAPVPKQYGWNQLLTQLSFVPGAVGLGAGVGFGAQAVAQSKNVLEHPLRNPVNTVLAGVNALVGVGIAGGAAAGLRGLTAATDSEVAAATHMAEQAPIQSPVRDQIEQAISQTPNITAEQQQALMKTLDASAYVIANREGITPAAGLEKAWEGARYSEDHPELRGNVGAVVQAAKEPDGGATLNHDLTSHEGGGYAVSVAGHEKQIPAEDFSAQDLTDYRNEVGPHLAPNSKIGVWHNPEDGNVYLDVSNVHDTKEAALAEGAAQGQHAIYDLNNFESIPTGVTSAEHDAIAAAHSAKAQGVEPEEFLKQNDPLVQKIAEAHGITPATNEAGFLNPGALLKDKSAPYEGRSLTYKGATVQPYYKSESSFSSGLQTVYDSKSEHLANWVDEARSSDSALKRMAGKALTPLSSRGRVPKALGMRALQEINRTKTINHDTLSLLTNLGKRQGIFKSPIEGNDFAHFYYAQLSPELRSPEGLQKVHDMLAGELGRWTSGDMTSSLADQIQELKDARKVASKDGDVGEVFRISGQIKSNEEWMAQAPTNISNLQAELGKLSIVIKNPPPVNEDAINAIRDLSQQTRDIKIEAGLNPETAQAREGLLMRAIGEEPTGEESYVPHRIAGDKTGARFPRGPGLGKGATIKGMNSQNREILLRSGRLDHSMAPTINDWNSAQAYVFHNQAKNDLGSMGEVLKPGDRPDMSKFVLVNPKGQNVPRGLTVNPELQAATEGFPDMQDINEYAQNYLASDESAYERMIQQATENGHLDQIRVVPKDVAQKYLATLLGNRIDKASMREIVNTPSLLGKAFDAATNATYISLIYTNPGYVPGILMQNLVFAGLHQGAMLPANLSRSAELLLHGPQDIRTLIKGEVGVGALPSVLVNKTAQESLVQSRHAFVRYIHNVPDLTPRVASFLHEAARGGYISKFGPKLTAKDYEGLRTLLTDPAHKPFLNDAVARGTEAQVRFNRASGAEAQAMRRIGFVWQWTRGASAWPIRFVIDHPMRTMMGAAVGSTLLSKTLSNDLLTRNVPIWMNQSIKAGSTTINGKSYPRFISTHYMNPGYTLQSMSDFFTHPSAANFAQMINPVVGAGINTLKKEDTYGYADNKGYLDALGSNVESLVPDIAIGKDLAHPQPSALYPGDSSVTGRLERASRLPFPIPYDPSQALKDAENQGLTGNLSQAHQASLLRDSQLAGMGTPPASMVKAVKYDTDLTHISDTTKDTKTRMQQYIAYYDKATGKHSWDVYMKAAENSPKMQEAIIRSIRAQLVTSTGLSRWQSSVKKRLALKGDTP